MSLEDDKIEQQKDLAALIHWFDKGGYANTLRVFSDPLVRGVRGQGGGCKYFLKEGPRTLALTISGLLALFPDLDKADKALVSPLNKHFLPPVNLGKYALLWCLPLPIFNWLLTSYCCPFSKKFTIAPHPKNINSQPFYQHRTNIP